MTIFEAIVLAIIEGITEFLPISSTGHMILGSSLLGMDTSNAFLKLFTVAIQFGAILSVLVLYFKRFFQSMDFYFKLAIAFLPAVFFGILFSDKIDQLLESPLGVAISLLLGGIILLFVDRWFSANQIERNEDISYATAFKIGLFQCLSMIPGTSRSAASIVGGMSQQLSRTLAAEFSFFLAIPTMFGATLKKLYDYYSAGYTINSEEIKLLMVGNLVAFVVAMLAIKFFISFLQKNGFRLFGWYRIIVGILILTLLLGGYDLKVV